MYPTTFSPAEIRIQSPFPEYPPVRNDQKAGNKRDPIALDFVFPVHPRDVCAAPSSFFAAIVHKEHPEQLRSKTSSCRIGIGVLLLQNRFESIARCHFRGCHFRLRAFQDLQTQTFFLTQKQPKESHECLSEVFRSAPPQLAESSPEVLPWRSRFRWTIGILHFHPLRFRRNRSRNAPALLRNTDSLLSLRKIFERDALPLRNRPSFSPETDDVPRQ